MATMDDIVAHEPKQYERRLMMGRILSSGMPGSYPRIGHAENAPKEKLLVGLYR